MVKLLFTVQVFLLSMSLFCAPTGLAAQSSDIPAQGVSTESSRKVVVRVQPTYPSMARRMNLAGTVKLEANVLPDGSVKSVQVKGGHPLLAVSAQDALRSWKWEKADRGSVELVEFKFVP